MPFEFAERLLDGLLIRVGLHLRGRPGPRVAAAGFKGKVEPLDRHPFARPAIAVSSGERGAVKKGTERGVIFVPIQLQSIARARCLGRVVEDVQHAPVAMADLVESPQLLLRHPAWTDRSVVVETNPQVVLVRQRKGEYLDAER